jgi:phosphatidylglycerol lysyltransferase
VKKRIVSILGPLLGVAVFLLVLWVLHRELRHFRYRDIVRQLHQLPVRVLLLSLLLTALNYWVMTGYDVLALRYLRQALSYGRIALASFTSYVFSVNVGLSVVGATAVRYRLYSIWGLSALQIGTVVVFSGLTTWLGILTLGGVAFVIEPPSVSGTLQVVFRSARVLGAVFLLIVAAYLSLGLIWRRPIKIRNWELRFPSVAIRLVQVCIGSLDWALAAAALYVLLPPTGLPLTRFTAIYLMAQIAALASHVPGGLGVFETVFLLLVKDSVPPPLILGSLVAYRVIYYLLPLCAGALLLGAHDAFRQREAGIRLAQGVARWAPQFAPHVFAVIAFFGGVLLLFSGAVPAVDYRLAWLDRFMPLAVLEASHFLGSLAGVGLILIARALQRRINAAYYAAVALLAAGIVLSLAKGLDYEEAIILVLMLAALLPCRGEFYRRASIFSERFTFGWVAAIILALGSTAWLGIFSHRHLEYSKELWWRFSLLEGGGPRFLRAMVGAAAVALAFAMARLFRPARPRLEPPGAQVTDVIRAIVEASPKAYARLALLGDKSFVLNDSKTSFIMYGVQGRSWIALGEPVGPEAEWGGLVWRFKEMVDEYGGWTVFHTVGKESLPLYVDLGLTLLKIGEDGRVPLATFSLEGGARKELRRDHRRVRNEGCSFEVVAQPQVPGLLPELRAVSDAWLEAKNARELGFSLGCFSEPYIRLFPVAVVRKNGNIVAFANVWLGAGGEELSPDLMRYSPDAPRDVMDYLFVELMFWGKEHGYHHFDLGAAPLSGIEARAAAPLWNKLSMFIYRHGEHFYNFQGLRQYKEKFVPIWEPKYLASPGGLALPRILVDLAGLITGGLKGIAAK